MISIKRHTGGFPQNYIFVDSGYLGNFRDKVKYTRMIPNAMHPPDYDVPRGEIFSFLRGYDKYYETEYLKMLENQYDYSAYNGAIIIPPSRKYCFLEEIDPVRWAQVVEYVEYSSYFDSFYVRKKSKDREERMLHNPIYNDMSEKSALICHSSIASVDALLYGMPFIDLGAGPLVHMSSNKKSLSRNKFHSQEQIVDALNKLLFYQCVPFTFKKKLLEIMHFYECL